MGKAKSKARAGKPATSPDTKGPQAVRTLADLRQHQDLWYKARVLVYDLYNMSKDRTCENRTLQTTDPLYISAPYFTPEEAATVKGAIVEVAGTTTPTTLEQAISTSLENFFEKRRASGDCRPCGPHDMVPVYLACLGMDKAEIEDEKFISRLRRSGIGKV